MAKKPDKTDEPQSAGPNFAKAHLKAFIERVENLLEEKAAIASDIRDVFAEAKGQGFDIRALRTIIKMRKQDAAERNEHMALVEIYWGALSGTPLGDWGIKNEKHNPQSATTAS